MNHRYGAVVILLVLLVGNAAAQSQATLTPSMDNTMYEESGDLSNGEGQHFFVGRTGGQQGTESRRALASFDVADSLPEDARVDSVALLLTLSNAPPGSPATDIDIHRLTRSWGEATSDAGDPGGRGAEAQSGDATWTHALYDTETWETPGGDYEAAASATFSVDGPGAHTATSDGLAADVQSWLDEPDSNFGWILIGDESSLSTARRFDSGDHATASNRPQLTVYYSTATAAEQPDVARSFTLEGNYPNPFSRSTSVRYTLDRAQEVGLEVYDVTGRPVKTVARRMQAPGPREVKLESGGLASGLYIYCLRTSSTRECRTFTVMR